MSRFLNDVGLAYFWSKIKSHVATEVNNAKETVGDYTVNGYAISTNPVLNKADVGLSNVTNDAQVKRTEMGVANGVATLDSSGLVPAAQLPSYVDDVLEYANVSSFPSTGETGKIYVALDSNLTYRWSGSTYIEISKSLALGETSSTAYAGDKGAANRAAINSLPSTLISSVSRGTVGANTITINVNRVTKSGLNYGSPAAVNFDLPAATNTAAGLLTGSWFSILEQLNEIAKVGILKPGGSVDGGSGDSVDINIPYTVNSGDGWDNMETTINIPAATGSDAGVMSSDMFNKLDAVPYDKVTDWDGVITRIFWDSSSELFMYDTIGGTDNDFPIQAVSTTGSIPGLMTVADKNKLDGIAAGAQVNDHLVIQNAIGTTNGNFSILGGATAGNTGAQTAAVNKMNGLTYNPSTSELWVSKSGDTSRAKVGFTEISVYDSINPLCKALISRTTTYGVVEVGDNNGQKNVQMNALNGITMTGSGLGIKMASGGNTTTFWNTNGTTTEMEALTQTDIDLICV